MGTLHATHSRLWGGLLDPSPWPPAALLGASGYHPRLSQPKRLKLAYGKPMLNPLYKTDDKTDDKSMSLLQSLYATGTCM